MKVHLSTSDDHIRDACGVFGIHDHEDAATFAILGLHALQHRGQESAGVVTFDGASFHARRRSGLVGDAFGGNGKKKIHLPGNTAIGHVRYSTAGGKDGKDNIQPFLATTGLGDIAIAHNGNLTNHLTLREQLIEQGTIFRSSADTEVILHLIATGSGSTLQERLSKALLQVHGAYALVLMSGSTLIGVRDPSGVRPLVLGQLGDSYILASETCALDIINADYVRDIAPGEMVFINESGLKSFTLDAPAPERFCIFEHIYFMRPNSFFGGLHVSEVREAIGRELVKESPVDADVVIPVPDSGVHAAVGYAEQSGIAYKQGIIRSHYVGRTFIEPTNRIRNLGAKLKLSVNAPNVKDKRVILIDDSIVRSTTMPKIIDMVRKAGAKEVHVRISSPPFAHPCFYGIDTPTQNELIAHKMSVGEIEKQVNADSLAYISLEGLYKAVNSTRNGEERTFCDACFTGEYSLPLTDKDQNKHVEEAA